MKLTSIDGNQISRYSFNEELMANRVQVVGSDNITVNIDTKPMEEAIKSGFAESVIKQPNLQIITIPEIIKEKEIQTIEIPVIVKELQIIEIEKPIITTKVEIIEIIKQVFIPEIKIIEIEKPVYITKTEYIKVDNNNNKLNYIILIINSLAIMGMVLKLFIK